MFDPGSAQNTGLATTVKSESAFEKGQKKTGGAAPLKRENMT